MSDLMVAATPVIMAVGVSLITAAAVATTNLLSDSASLGCCLLIITPMAYVVIKRVHTRSCYAPPQEESDS